MTKAQALEQLRQHLDPSKRVSPYISRHIVPRITCADGFSLSVQASEMHYCEPRNNVGPWEAVEVGFPSKHPRSWSQYAERFDRRLSGVYAYIPLELVAAVVARHGGVKE